MGGSVWRLNGIVVIDKPEGIASYDVVRRLKGLLSGVKIGFLGTLDPLATGVLPLLLGEGTKLAPFLEAGRKVYEANLHLGVVTDTQDREGQVLQSVDLAAFDLSPQRIEEVIKRFRGRIMQRPPMFSALKQRGEPLYKLARRGEEAERALRGVEIYELRLTEIDPPSLDLYIECSKGTYIRTLGHDIGGELGCGAHVTALRRTRSGPFSIEDALPLAEVEGLLRQRQLKKRIIPLAQAMGFLPVMEVGEAAALQISNGQVIPLAGPAPQGGRQEAEVVRVVARNGGGLVAVGAIRQEKEGLVLRPLRVFHDAFTKRLPYGKDKVPTMVDQGGR